MPLSEMKVRIPHQNNITATIIPPASVKVKTDDGRELDLALDQIEPILPAPPPELGEKAHERALEAAEEHGVPIDRICIAASPDGSHFQVIVLDHRDLTLENWCVENVDADALDDEPLLKVPFLKSIREVRLLFGAATCEVERPWRTP